MPLTQQQLLKTALRDVALFSSRLTGIRLRSYQQVVAQAVLASVFGERGRSFVIMFPRQSGKNELQAGIEAYLLLVLSQQPAEIVKVSPTWKPQSQNAMRRLERVLQANHLTRQLWRKENGYIYRIGQARATFLSGAPESNIVGATASTLLEVDEAQDVLVSKFDREIAPMAASTNATRVFWGTAWTAATLLGRELRLARLAQQSDGIRRVFTLSAEQVAAEVPAYGDYVRAQVAMHGRDNPMVRSQYFSEEVDGAGGMFNPGRVALLLGDHPRLEQPRAGHIYAGLLDVAGEDENQGSVHTMLTNPRRDSTALTVVEVDTATLADDLIRRPTYRVVHRRTWQGVRHASLYSQLRALADHWRMAHLVVDATGVGAGLSAFLSQALPGRVIPFNFSLRSKSQLGWQMLDLVEQGRFKEYHPPDDLFLRQLRAVEYEILPGVGQVMRWAVPEGARDPVDGALLHDDLVLSAALVGVLDSLEWHTSRPATVLPGDDPLRELDRGF
ncbi:MAG: hypothetical protein HPY76_00945 [Anaerolineae bacterium]|nr:hypothetical protein [Anaerolineae bacterium]